MQKNREERGVFMDHELETSILKLQKDGLRLYGALSEFYFWLGYRSMSDILRDKFMRLADCNMETRRAFVEDTGEMIAPAKGEDGRPVFSYASHEPPRTYRLQWQEGTNEPEDKPNVSNGEDTVSREIPTRQPWEDGFSGSSGLAPDGKGKRAMYDASLDRWLKYEEDAARLYEKMASKSHPETYGMWVDMMREAREETERLRND